MSQPPYQADDDEIDDETCEECGEHTDDCRCDEESDE